MKPYREMSKEELASLKEQLTAVYKEYQGKNLSLNMARGKPSPDQLDLSLPMLDVLNSKSDFMTAGRRCEKLRCSDRYPGSKGINGRNDGRSR